MTLKVPMEEIVYLAFRFGNATIGDAVNGLIGAGYLRDDAEEMVSEWADEAEWCSQKHLES